MKIIDTESNTVWVWIGGFIIGALTLFYFAYFANTPSFPLEPVNNQSNLTDNTTLIVDKNSTTVPFYQRIVMLIKYDKDECPNLQVKHFNNTFNITTVKNISVEINYVALGRYNTNDPNFNDNLVYEYLNINNCTPDQIFITNNQFISLLLEYEVPVAEKEKEEEENLSIESRGDLNYSNKTYEINAPFVHDSKYL